MKQDTKRGLKRQRDYLATDADRLRAQLARLVEAARSVANHTHSRGGVPSWSISNLRAVLDELEKENPC